MKATDPGNGPVLSIEGLDAAFGSGMHFRVGRLVVGRGERVVLFGPNGAGKTTLLRMVAGLDPAPADTLAAAASTYLPQRPYLFRGRGAWNLHLGLDEAARERATELAARFGVTPLLDRQARSFSGGERQRLVLARTLARSEPLVLLDEPLAPFDARDRIDAARTIVSALDGRAVISVTHDHDEAVVLGNRIAVLAEGRLLQDGPVGEVLTLPADDEVAAVLGVGNALDGEVVSGDGTLAMVQVGDLEVWGLGDVDAGGFAVALFGAEAVTILPAEAAEHGSARNTWRGRVIDIRPAGKLVEVVVEAGAVLAALITPGSRDAMELTAGDEVTLAVKATAVRVIAR